MTRGLVLNNVNADSLKSLSRNRIGYLTVLVERTAPQRRYGRTRHVLQIANGRRQNRREFVVVHRVFAVPRNNRQIAEPSVDAFDEIFERALHPIANNDTA